MGTGWRKAFCSTIPKEREAERPTHRHHHHKQQQQQPPLDVNLSPNSDPNPNPNPKGSSKLGLFSSMSNPSTPRLRVRTTASSAATAAEKQPSTASSSSGPSPKLQCKLSSNSSSPRSPFAILKNSLRLTKNGCGVCMQSVKTGQGKAIYTAECSHAFHFPCIAAHVKKQGCLICPVCNLKWKDVPLLSIHSNNNNNNNTSSEFDDPVMVDKSTITTTKDDSSSARSAPATPTGSARIHFEDKRVLLKKSGYRFNDDEPLLSGSPRFSPIPEEKEKELESELELGSESETLDSDEFKGFQTSVDPYNSVDKKAPKIVEVKLLPEAAVVSGSRTHETYAVALRVKGPPPANLGQGRVPVDLVTVLDVSGSMSGPKLVMLKRAMRLVVSSLTSSDRLSIVAFSSSPRRLMPLRRMTSQAHRSACKIIDHLSSGQGGTSVAQALSVAAKVLDDRRQKNPVCTIVLLSDGQDDPSATAAASRGRGSLGRGGFGFAHIEIPVHPSGFGFRAHEADQQEQQQDGFSKCVGGLLTVVVRDLRVHLGFSSGSAEVVAVYSCSGRPSLMSSDSARLGDLYAEEERELLIELKVPVSAIGSHHVMSVRCSYRDPVTQEVMYGRERALLVPRPHAVRSSDPRIERLRNLFVYTRAVAESRRLVEHCDFNSAHHLLSSARALVLQSASASAEEYGRGLECELAHVHWRKQYHQSQNEQETSKVAHHMVDEHGEPLTPTSAWRAAEQLAKMAKFKKSLHRSVSDLHGFENARF